MGAVYEGRTVAVVEDVIVRGMDGRGAGAGAGAAICGLKSGGLVKGNVVVVVEPPSDVGGVILIAGDGDGTRNGSASPAAGLSGSGVSATLNRLDGRANGLFGLSEASCEGRRTNGDCLSGDSIGEAALAGDWKPFVGDVIVGVTAMTVDGDLGTGDSGRLKGDARGENDMTEGLSCVQYP